MARLLLRSPRSYSCLVAIAAGLGCVLAPPAAAEGTPPGKQPALIADAATGEVLYENQAHRRWYPASLAKLMTLYLTFEALDSGELAADEHLVVSAVAAGQSPVKLGLSQRRTIDVADAVSAVATVSANDAAVVLAERLSGSEAAFAARMSEKATELGMTRTVFRNATGLPDAAQYTTSRDMALLARRLLQDFPERYRVFSSRSFTYRGRWLGAHNALLSSYSGADGMKTGFTCASGYNLVASAERDGRRLIGVVLGSTSRKERDRRMARLLDGAFGDDEARSGMQGLEDLEPASMLVDTAPPKRLSDSVCARPGKLSSWGLLLGIFPQRQDARVVVSRVQQTLAGKVRRGTPVYLKREFEHGSSWKALLVGFDQDEAGRACKQLWNAGYTCVPQTPQRMNHPQYAQR